jgi:hypothetical protein
MKTNPRRIAIALAGLLATAAVALGALPVQEHVSHPAVADATGSDVLIPLAPSAPATGINVLDSTW